MLCRNSSPIRMAIVGLAATWVALTGRVYAQAPAGFTPQGDVRQVSLSADEGIVAARLEASRAKQIRVVVQVLSVDDETRATIYQDLGHDAVKTRGSKIPQAAPTDLGVGVTDPSAESQSHLGSSRRIGTTSHVSTSVMDPEATTQLLTRIQQSPESELIRTPTVILLDGRQAGYSDIAQRPFIVDLEQMEGGLSPVVQVLEEGSRIRVQAALSEWDGDAPQKIRLSSEISWHKIVGMETKQVFGIEEVPTPIQVPTYVVKTATATEELSKGQALLVDPYLTHTVEVEPESRGSALKMLPYVSRNLKATKPTQVERNLMYVLHPQVQ